MKQFKKPSNRNTYRTPTPFPEVVDESANERSVSPEIDKSVNTRSSESKFKPFKVAHSSMPSLAESSEDEVEFVEVPKKPAAAMSHRSKPNNAAKDNVKSNSASSRAKIVYTKPSVTNPDDSERVTNRELEPSPNIVDLSRVAKERPKPIPLFKSKQQKVVHASDDGYQTDHPNDVDNDNSSELTPRVSRSAVQDNDTTPVARNNSRSASPSYLDITPKANRISTERKQSEVPLNAESLGRQTRLSNGISKKRVLLDAAILSSDDELPNHITPKKPRISSSKTVVLVNTQASDANGMDSDDEDAEDNVIAIKPIDLGLDKRASGGARAAKASIYNTKGKARAGSELAEDSSPPPPAQREHVDGHDADDVFASDLATATRLSLISSNERRSRAKSDNSTASSSKREDSTMEGRLHPDEIAAIDTAMRRTRNDALRATDVAKASKVLSTTGPTDTERATLEESNHCTDTVIVSPETIKSNPSSASRRTFGNVVKTPGKTPMINAGVMLLDETMKFRVQLGALRPWNAPPGSGSTMISVWFSGWAVQCPNLDFDTACAIIRMQKYKNFVNPSRVSPLDLNILYTSNDNKRSIMQANFKTAVCLSPILTRDSYLLEPTTVGLRNKYISGHFHHQEWERLEALACMVFDKKVMTAQIRDGALSFTTMGNVRGDREMSSPNRPPRNPTMLSAASSRAQSAKSKVTKPDASVRSVLDLTDDIPVYDARGVSLNFASDLDDLDERLPRWIDEVPPHSFAVVGYTMGHYEKENRANLTTNVLFVILLATEGSDE